MFNLAEYRKKPKMLADFLPWAALVAPGVVLNKDGSFQRSAQFRGPDLDSATPAELVGTTARLNSALRRLGSGSRSLSRQAVLRHGAIRRAGFPTLSRISSMPSAERNSRKRERISRARIT
jgi:type IV secretory pathway VirB4 component